MKCSVLSSKQLGNMNKIMLIATLLILNSCATSKVVISTKSELDKKLQGVLDYKRLTGFSVSIFTKDSVIYQKAFGYSDWELKTSYSLDTKQIIASISKTTIGVALMKGQELGLFSLDDPINNHLPFKVVNPHYPESIITIRHLAMHTSSIKYSEEMTDTRGNEFPQMSLKEFTQSYLNREGKWYDESNFHKSMPGELGDYTNVGATLAAYLIENKSGMKFSEFSEKYIFESLGMTSTSYFYGSNSDAKYYTYKSQNNFEKIEPLIDGMYPNGSQVTNIVDLTTFCQSIMNNGRYGSKSILTSNSIKEMLTVSKLRSLDEDIYRQGIFWSTMKSPLGIPREMIGHNGGDNGVYSMMYFDQKSGIGYILLSNTGLSDENHVSMVGIYKSLWNYANSKSLY